MDLFKREIDAGALVLRQGGVVAFPTETVYGLGARVFDEEAISKIFSLKGRPPDNPLIVHIAKLEELSLIAQDVPKEVYILAEKFWPGPLSIILESKPEVPEIVRAGLPSVGVRMPAHPMALALIEAAGQPLAAPSANLSGKPSSTMSAHVTQDFGLGIPIIPDGGFFCEGLESTVIDMRQPQAPTILRPGAITRDMLESVLGYAIRIENIEQLIAMCPGTKYRHYAPDAPIYLFYDEPALANYLTTSPDVKRKVLSSTLGTLSAKTFYDSLRKADYEGCKEVVILCDPQVVCNEGLYNRILKASRNEQV